jgi:hypothetical protein
MLATRIVLVLVLLGLSGLCVYAFVSVFGMQPSVGGLGSVALGVLLLIVAVLGARPVPKSR